MSKLCNSQIFFYITSQLDLRDLHKNLQLDIFILFCNGLAGPFGVAWALILSFQEVRKKLKKN